MNNDIAKTKFLLKRPTIPITAVIDIPTNANNEMT
jgi:hypothetical protein